MTKRILFVVIMAMAIVSLVASPVFAGDFAVKNWRVFNVMPDTAKYWDINPVKNSEGIQFPIQQFDTKTTGSFAVYFLANYNFNLTGKTMTTSVSWTQGTYETRGTAPGAYVRFWFQDVASGPYDVNDYWWSTVSLDLNTLSSSSGQLLASLGDRTLWTNMAGLPATDDTTEHYYAPWNNSTAKDTPYDGFTKAMKNVKQLGLSFGSSASYASGVAFDGGTGMFNVSSFTIN
jgi:hypothetical protein